MNIHPFIIFVTGILTMLWAYSSFYKLYEFGKFKQAMDTQVFPKWIGKILVYVIPTLEIILIILLLIPKTRLLGMYGSLFLMTLFTMYVGGATFGIYGRYPCACGGIFSRLGWKRHFKFNLIFTIIALAGVVLIEI